MKVKILQENLLRSLIKTTRVISQKTQLPILQNALISTENGALRLTATNMESSLSTLVGSKNEKEGSVCAPAKLLTELVSSLPPETITLESTESSLLVIGSKSHTVLPVVSAAEFPPLSFDDKGATIDFEKNDFLDLFSSVLFSAATDEGRPVLTGVKLTIDENIITAAATDGYRLSVKKIDNIKIKPSQASVLLPAKTIGEVIKVIGEEKSVSVIRCGEHGEGQFIFIIGDTTIVSRVIDGDYPNYTKIIPTTHTSRITVDVAEFQKAVKSVSLFARDNANIVKIHIGKSEIVVSANTPQVGENTIEVESETEGDVADIAFNSRFLSEMLSNMKNERVVLEMTGSLNSGCFKDPKQEGYLHIIMPVRIQT